MDPSDLPLWLLALGAILGTSTATAIVTHLLERQSRSIDDGLTDAQATDVIVNAGRTAVELMKAELDRAIRRIDHLEDENARLKKKVRELEEHVRRLESES